MLKIVEGSVPVEIYGEVFNLKKPTWGQIESLDEQTKANPDQAKEVLRAMLKALGLREDVFDKMAPGDTAEIVKYLSGGGKK